MLWRSIMRIPLTSCLLRDLRPSARRNVRWRGGRWSSCPPCGADPGLAFAPARLLRRRRATARRIARWSGGCGGRGRCGGRGICFDRRIRRQRGGLRCQAKVGQRSSGHEAGEARFGGWDAEAICRDAGRPVVRTTERAAADDRARYEHDRCDNTGNESQHGQAQPHRGRSLYRRRHRAAIPGAIPLRGRMPRHLWWGSAGGADKYSGRFARDPHPA